LKTTLLAALALALTTAVSVPALASESPMPAAHLDPRVDARFDGVKEERAVGREFRGHHRHHRHEHRRRFCE